MLFNSVTFGLFFVAVLAIYSLPISWRAKKTHLLLSSYLFYAAWNPPFVILIWISTIVDWNVAAALGRAKTVALRRTLLLASLVTNLGMLGFFKYGDFFLQNFITLASYLGLQYQGMPYDIVLPVGISFYTFQTLSYTIDVYRGDLERSDSFLDFALFVTFFPQLVAGPIVRAKDFLPQLLAPVKAVRHEIGVGAYPADHRTV